MNNTLPQVKNAAPWKPKNISVIIKEVIRAGKNFLPISAGT